jgi:ketosteroid isomerase-like protein
MDVVADFVAAFPISDVSVATKYLAEDFVAREPVSLPYGGDWTGADAYIRLIDQVLATWSELVFESMELFHQPGSEFVFAVLQVSGRGKYGGFAMPVIDWLRVHDGKITELTAMYHDTKHLCNIHYGADFKRTANDKAGKVLGDV